MNSESLVAAMVLLATLSACGGGDDTVPTVPDQVPASALVSAQAFSTYAGSLPLDDRAEPLSLDGIEPPTSETEEPIDAS